MLLQLDVGNKGNNMALYTSVAPASLQTEIWGTLKPHTGFSYPTHITQNSKGGYQSVPLITATNPPVANREEGMIVWQESTSKHYMLTGLTNTWSEISEVESNGLYQYTRFAADSNGVILEMYKWDTGRLEYFIIFPGIRTVHTSGEQFYGFPSSSFNYPLSFRWSDLCIHVCTAFRTSNTGIAWGAMRSVGINSCVPYFFSTTLNTIGTCHVSVYGTWK